MAKDLTKFSISGIAQNLGKARVVLEVIKDFAKKNSLSFDELKNEWPDILQGGKGVVRIWAELDEQEKTNYFDDSIIILENSVEIAVCRQWGAGNFPKFITHALEKGYEILPSNSVNSSNPEINNLTLPESILNSLKQDENPDENIFVIYKYLKEHKLSEDELENLFLAIVHFKPNAKLAATYAIELLDINRNESAIRILENRANYQGDEHDWSIFESAVNDLKRLTTAEEFELYSGKTNDTSEHDLKISIHGRMSQLFLCKKEANDAVEEIEDHYQNILSWFFKIDADNLIIIELDGEKVYEGNVSNLGINHDDLNVFSDESYIIKKRLKHQLSEITKQSHFNKIDSDEILVSAKNNLLVINEGGLDYGLSLESAPNFENRYTYEEYGKFHIETTSIKVSNFKLSDLYFHKDTNIEDLIGEGAEPYVFSKIHHYQIGELELEIVSNEIKDAYLYKGWPYDC